MRLHSILIIFTPEQSKYQSMNKRISSSCEPSYFWIELISHTQDRVTYILYNNITHNLTKLWKRSFFFYILCRHVMWNTVNVHSSCFEPFLDPLSELTGINMLSSQSGSRRNLPLLLSCSSLWFTTWYSVSSLSPVCPPEASKNSTKAWHMNNCMAAQCSIDVPPSVVCEALWFGPLEGGKDWKRFPHQSPGCHNCQVNISHSSCRAVFFIMGAGGHGSSTVHSGPH